MAREALRVRQVSAPPMRTASAVPARISSAARFTSACG